MAGLQGSNNSNPKLAAPEDPGRDPMRFWTDEYPGGRHRAAGTAAALLPLRWRSGLTGRRSCSLAGIAVGLRRYDVVPWQDGAMRILIKLVISAVAVWVATLLVPGIELQAHSTLGKIATLVVVALIFGIVNAVLKPIAKALGCLAYAITLGLISIVVNGLLFWLTSYIAGKLAVPFHITGFVPAVIGALIVGVVGWVLSLIVDRDDARS